MKILHTSDLHIGSSLYKLSLEEDNRYILDEIIRAAKEEEVRLIIVSGDVYDTGNLSGASADVFSDFTRKAVKESKIPMVVIAGNHDSGQKLSLYSSILEDEGLYIAGRLTKDIKPVESGDINVWPVPYFEDNEAWNLFGEQGTRCASTEEAMKAVVEHIKGKMDRSKTNILVIHAFVGAETLKDEDKERENIADDYRSGAEASIIGGSQMVRPDIFKGFDYVACGHIHRFMKLAGNSFYSGSPMQVSFDEKGTKGVVIYDTETGEIRQRELKPLRRLETLEGSLGDLKSPGTVSEHRDNYVRIVLTDSLEGTNGIRNELLELYPRLCGAVTSSFVSGGSAGCCENAPGLTKDTAAWTPVDWVKGFFEKIGMPEPDADMMKLFENEYNNAISTREE